MASITVKKIVWFRPQLDTLLKKPSGAVGRHLAVIGAKIQAGARAQVGVKTGKLKASIRVKHYRTPIGQYITVGSTLKYAYLHHEGTRPHIITPNKSKLLRFPSRRGIVVARAVFHPGTKPNRYLTDQLRYARA